QGRGGSALPGDRQEPGGHRQGDGAFREPRAQLDPAVRRRRGRRRNGGAHHRGARGVERPPARGQNPSAGAGHSEASHRFFREGGDVVTLDVRLFAEEVGAPLTAVCRALSLPRSTMYARENSTLSARAVDTVEL